MQIALMIIGFALCGMSLMQLAFWASQSLQTMTQTKRQYQLSLELLRKEIDERIDQNNEAIGQSQTLAWKGFRWFRVAELVKETHSSMSVYLEPEDGKPISFFKPGQHLTVRLRVSGESKPVVRCYSLSDSPNAKRYRITVKKATAPRDQPSLPSGTASTHINESSMVGDRLEVKAPSGHFWIDEESSQPAILLAGGIGITPLMSMTTYLLESNSQRTILLVYGTVNGADQTFKTKLSQWSQEHPNFTMVSCFARPEPSDLEGRDYQVRGFATIDLLKKLLPNNQCQFYLCGPPAFMNAFYDGLTNWGVAESQIHHEAFGPASIGSPKNLTRQNAPSVPAYNISFVKSGLTAEWSSDFDSVLELAESSDIEMESGCRSGNCGTCSVPILNGSFAYENEPGVEVEPGHCLACVARPVTDLEVDA